MAISMSGSTAVPRLSRSAGGLASRGARRFAVAGRASARQITTLVLALCVLVPSGLAQTLRVTSWNLDPVNLARTNGAAANTNGIRIPAAATALKKLNPDVILLQQVRDWQMCEDLAQALRPAKYNILTCSAFRDARTGTLRRQQVAILAKAKAYFAWSEPWHNRGVPPLPGGFAFAALQIGTQRVGFFSVQTGAGQTGAAKNQQNRTSPAPLVSPLSPASALWLAAERATTSPPARQQERLAAAYEQLLEHVGSVSNWVANRVQAFVVGSTLGGAAGQDRAAQDTPLRLLEGAGFGDAFQDTPDTERATMRGRAGQPGVTADYIFTQPASRTANLNILRVAVSRRFPVTCDVVLGPPATVVAQTDRTEAEAPREPQPSFAEPSEPKAQPKPVERAPASPPTQPRERPLQPTAPVETAATPPPTQPGPPAAAATSQPSILNLQLLLSAAALVGVVALAAVVWILARRTRSLPPPRPALLTAGDDVPSGYTVVLGTSSATESASADRHSAPAPTAAMQIEPPGITQTQAEVLRQRVLAAEQRAERASAIIRAGLLPHLRHWLKQKLARKLIVDRTQLLQTQQAATLRTMAVEQRLARIEQQVKRQNESYQQRLAALTRELLVAKEENRELIRARIVQVRADMEAARARLMAQSYPDEETRG